MPEAHTLFLKLAAPGELCFSPVDCCFITSMCHLSHIPYTFPTGHLWSVKKEKTHPYNS